jgi:CheY-like chemotaxis protein
MIAATQRPCVSKLLVIEDQLQDLRTAESAALAVGFTTVERATSIRAAMTLLTKPQEDGHGLPDAILLDLDLGQDSGYEILRYRYSSPELKNIPVLVWTRLLQSHRQMCELFKVNVFLEKQDGTSALSEALTELRSLVDVD